MTVMMAVSKMITKIFGEGTKMNAIVKHEPMSNDQVGLVKRMIAKDATDDELSLFLQQCSRTGLDPFSKQIYAISRFSKRDNRKVMSIQVSIDGARLIAERTGKYDNQEGPYWCGDDGVWKDVWLTSGNPKAAKVLVYKVGSERATTGIAHWSEYADTTSNFWQTKPALMLAKCAEMLALRKAFPQELSDLYASEEMEQVDSSVIDVTPRIVNQDTGEIVDNPFEKEASSKVTLLSKEQLEKLKLLGGEFYGKEWDEQCPKLVEAVSKGAIVDIEKLTDKEADKLIKGIKKRIDERAAAQTQPVEVPA